MHYQAVVFDWAGTIVDWGCQAPVVAFADFFHLEFNIDCSYVDINQFMGQNKKDHLLELLKIYKPDHISNIDRLYNRFHSVLLNNIVSHSSLIPDALEAVNTLRSMGFKIGSSTGYPKDVMKILQHHAELQGYKPDCVVTADEVPGRPNPAMLYLNSVLLNVYPMSKIIAVGDTISDIKAGVNAGATTIGVAIGGNLHAKYDSIVMTKNEFLAAGADAVAVSINEVPALVQQLEKKYHEKEKY